MVLGGEEKSVSCGGKTCLEPRQRACVGQDFSLWTTDSALARLSKSGFR